MAAGAPDSCPRIRALAAGEIKRQALERDGEIDALQLHVGRHLQRAGREVQHGLDPGRDHQIDHALCRRRGHGDDGDADAVAARVLLQIVDVEDRHAAARLLADLRAQVVEQRHDLEALLTEAGIVGEREAEVAGADDRDAQLAIEAEDLAQVTLEIADVVADAADAELAEVGEVLANLRRVQVELLGERLGRDGPDARALELVETAQVDREPVRGELGDLIEGLFGFDLGQRLCSEVSQALADCSKGAGRRANIPAMPVSDRVSPALRLQTVRRRRPSRPPSSPLKAVVIGALFGLLFGASTVYLGLRAGLTVSASIPIAVLAISVLKRLGGSTILENNIVQTIGSAGESVAGGVVFTIPALLFLAVRAVVLQLLPDHDADLRRRHPRRADDGAAPARAHREGARRPALSRRHGLRRGAGRRRTRRQARDARLQRPRESARCGKRCRGCSTLFRTEVGYTAPRDRASFRTRR